MAHRHDISEEQRRIRESVKEAYGNVAKSGGVTGGCGCGAGITDYAKLLGYTATELTAAPEASNLGLGCGNPTAIAGLKPGEAVLDLGAGAGFDCFLAAGRVGPAGKVIGVDMTPAMVEKARLNAADGGFDNVEFRLGHIEELPLADQSVDVAISNCVINLSVDKPQVFRELYRVLRPGGRIAISDMALQKELPVTIRESLEAYVGCVSGAVLVSEYEALVRGAGFRDVAADIKVISLGAAAGDAGVTGSCCGSGTADAGKKATETGSTDPLLAALESYGLDTDIAGYICSLYVTAIK